MKKNHALMLLSIFFFFQSIGQNTTIDSLEAKVEDYFKLDHETFYTHLNKTTYFTNEEIWFKSYIYDTKTQTPFISSTNLYISLFDENGTLVNKKIYAASDGMAHGNIKIDSTFRTGTYYLKTATNWSKNFNASYIQKIEIINSPKEPPSANDRIAASYDFQLLPEGGHIVADTKNTIGFKIIDALGEPVEITSGKVLDINNTIVAIFKSNPFGLGKFVLKPKSTNTYKCEMVLKNGETITRNITDIAKKGISLNVENKASDHITINLNSNAQTLSDLANRSYYALIHRDGLIKKIEIKFSNTRSTYSYKVDRSLLHKGINIITLINDKNKPIAERIIFNHDNTPMIAIENVQILKEKDSSIVKLNIGKAKAMNMSISVLPSKTKAHTLNSSILTSFLIHPYIKGTIDNPSYYFNNSDREKQYNLDLLLLTQGWSKYSWTHIFNHPPQGFFNFEAGFQIQGSINNFRYRAGDKIILQSLQNGILEESDVSETGTFYFDALYLKEGTDINFSLKDKKGNQTKPNVYYTISPRYITSTLEVEKDAQIKASVFNPDYESFVFEEGVTVLDSVTLKDVYKKPKPVNSPFGMALAEHISFKDDPHLNGLITDRLFNYFDVTNNAGNVTIFSRRAGSFGRVSPKVFLDNVDISGDLNVIGDLRIIDVEEMFVSTSPSNLYKSMGVIHIFSKRGRNRRTKSTYSDFEIGFGFSTPKTYYNPLYNKFNYENFNNYGALNWIPNLTANANGEFIFKIPNYYYDSLNLYIEGMSSDGKLISKIETINID